MELIVTILVLSILILVFTPKIGAVLERNSLEKLKSELSLIQFGLLELKNKNNLLQNSQEIRNLDSASVNQKNENLFDRVLQRQIKSTTTSEKKSGLWAKISNSNYIFYTRDAEFKFSLNDSFFTCSSSVEVCESLE